MTFRFQAKYGLLTYAQCNDLDPWGVVEHLSDLGLECIVGRESHSDGGVHLHVFFQSEQRFCSRNARVFDVGGYHPNVLPSHRTPEKMFDYATKDGDIVAGGLARPEPGEAMGGASDKWACIAASASVGEFWENVELLDPRALCTSFTSLRAFAEWRFRPVRDAYVHPDEILFVEQRVELLNLWVRSNIGRSSLGASCPTQEAPSLEILPPSRGAPPT